MVEAITSTLNNLGFTCIKTDWKSGDLVSAPRDEDQECAIVLALLAPETIASSVARRDLDTRIREQIQVAQATTLLIFIGVGIDLDLIDEFASSDFTIPVETHFVEEHSTVVDRSAGEEETTQRESHSKRRVPAEEIVELLAQNLIDLSRSNGLLNFRTGPDSIRIVRETANDLVRILTAERRTMRLEPLVDAMGRSEEGDEGSVRHVRKEEIDHTLPSRRELPAATYVDDLIQTSHPPKALQSVASRTYESAARTRRTTGSNQLFLALGFLTWYESPESEIQSQAPLVLVPISIDRTKQNVRERKIPGDADYDPDETGPQFREVPRYVFEVRFTGEEICENLALRLRFETAGLALPTVKPHLSDCTIEEYIEIVRGWAAGHYADKRWKVDLHATIGLFDFAQAWVYADLDSDVWRKADLSGLEMLFGGVRLDRPGSLGRDELERSEAQAEIPLVCPADTSQYEVIHRARDARALVVEGPPGTGKSQTIANIISACIAKGERVLFLAAKETALSVVAERLGRIGLGPFLLSVYANGKTSGASVGELSESVGARYQVSHKENPARRRQSEERHRQAKRRRAELSGIFDKLASKDSRTGMSISALIWEANLSWEQYMQLAEKCETIAVQVPIAELVKVQGLRAIEDRAADFLLLLDTMKENGQLQPDSVWEGLVVANLTEDLAKEILFQAAELSSAWTAFETTSVPSAILPRSMHSPCNLIRLANALGKATAPVWDFGVLGSEAVLGNETIDAQKAVTAFSGALVEYRSLAEQSQMPPQSLPSALKLSQLRESYGLLTARLTAWKTNGNQASFFELRERLRAARLVLGRIDDVSELWTQIPEGDPKQQPVATVRTWITFVELASKSAAVDWASIKSSMLVGEASTRAQSLRSRAADLIKEDQIVRQLLDPTCIPDAATRSSVKGNLRNDSWWSRHFGEQKKAVRQARSWLRQELRAKAILEAITRYETLIEGQSAFDNDIAAKRIFGALFDGRKTDWEHLGEVVHLAQAMVEAVGISRATVLITKPRPSLDISLSSAGLEVFAALEAELNVTPQLSSYGLTRLTALSWNDLIAGIDQVISDLALVIEWYGTLPSDEWRKASFNSLGGFLLNAEQLARVLEEVMDHKAKIFLGAAFLGTETNPKVVDQISCALGTIEAIKSVIPEKAVCDAFATIPWDKLMPELLAWSINSSLAIERLSRCEAALKESGTVRDGDPFLASRCTLSVDEWKLRVGARCRAPEGLVAWKALADRLQEGRRLGLGDLLDHFLAGEKVTIPLMQSAARASARRAYGEQVLREKGISPEIVNASYLQRIRKEFQEADRDLINYGPDVVSDACMSWSAPNEGISGAAVSAKRGADLLRYICAGKKTKVSMRDVMDRSLLNLQHIKPCWLMSPGSVSQYLPQRNDVFDVLIIDEASQLRTAEVAPAVLRCKRLLVFGDRMQMSPSILGQRRAGDAHADYELGESIIDLASRSLPSVRLTWHYRSQHEDLIKYSNRSFYDDQLIVFPTARPAEHGLGVFHEYVGGIYSGKRNPKEAQRAIEIMRAYVIAEREKPPHERFTVGIVAMNAEQRDFIAHLVDQLRSEDVPFHKALSESEHSPEPFFITNLESVQGDERDHMIICCTYGPAAEGLRTANAFGPVLNPGGERRLNVLFTRARRMMTVLTSMHPHEITAGSPGARHFRGFIEFARDKKLPPRAHPNPAAEINGFEEAVGDVLIKAGFQIEHQVGAEGYLIDIAVRDPGNHTQFVLAIECDGASYHSGRTARERDRLRQEILEHHGWNFHRIWSTDWFHERNQTEVRLLSIVRERVKSARAREALTEANAKESVQELGVPQTKTSSGRHTIDGGNSQSKETVDVLIEKALSVDLASSDYEALEPQGIQESLFERSVDKSVHGNDLTPEGLEARAISAAIIKALSENKYLRLEALLKSVCQEFSFDIRGERRSKFGKRVWRQVGYLSRQRLVRIGGVNLDSVSLTK